MKSLKESLLNESMNDKKFWEIIEKIKKANGGSAAFKTEDAAAACIGKFVNDRNRDDFIDKFTTFATEVEDCYVFKNTSDDGNQYCSWFAVANGENYYNMCMQSEEDGIDPRGEEFGNSKSMPELGETYFYGLVGEAW